MCKLPWTVMVTECLEEVTGCTNDGERYIGKLIHLLKLQLFEDSDILTYINKSMLVTN